MKKFVLILCAALLLVPSCKKNNGDSQKDGNQPGSPQYSTQDVNAVDLGLSVLWADRNIGAESPEDPGHFFAWGETTPRASFAFARPYIFDNIDAPKILSGKYDTATALWGDGWRMPTKAEFLALFGLQREQKKDDGDKLIGVSLSGNGHSIYIPVADLSSTYRSLGLWTSERGDAQEWVSCVDFVGGITTARREYAHAIRPVKDK